MDENAILHSKEVIKNVINNELVILDEDRNKLLLLNETSAFILNNCDERSTIKLVELLYSQLVDKDSIPFNIVLEDCKEAINNFIENKIIYYENQG